MVTVRTCQRCIVLSSCCMAAGVEHMGSNSKCCFSRHHQRFLGSMLGRVKEKAKGRACALTRDQPSGRFSVTVVRQCSFQDSLHSVKTWFEHTWERLRCSAKGSSQPHSHSHRSCQNVHYNAFIDTIRLRRYDGVPGVVSHREDARRPENRRDHDEQIVVRKVYPGADPEAKERKYVCMRQFSRTHRRPKPNETCPRSR